MHKSKLVTAVIDCQGDDLAGAARFWSAALGRTVAASDNPAKDKYVTLGSGKEELIVLLQKVPHPSRVHLDIESDDVEQEVKRLEALGAERVEQIKTWWVMEAPTGHRFCVVKPQRDGTVPDDANDWS
ncbi:MAG: VOC family protein [Burkholderiaceae bacterium]|nr:VOC family protein [Burkholderiaceae bacterium]